MQQFYLIASIMAILFSTVPECFAASPYINKVYEFLPAPGQFTNGLPACDADDTADSVAMKAQKAIANNVQGMVSLGAYGGYIVFGFDHMVRHVPGQYDFKILGNAFYPAGNPNGDALREGGSCEPGIVMVSYDANGNGIPDDPWYELAGSEYNSPKTIKNYRITYYKPDPNKVATPDNDYPYLNDTTYIKWKDNQGGQGYVSRNIYHSQSYYPSWIAADSIVFTGSRLANNYVDESGKGSYYVGYAYHWGYADNQPNTDDRSDFSIDWAVDATGNKVNLPGVNFVKVYTAVNQYNGWIGEVSTDILGAKDLHLLGDTVYVPVFTTGITLDKSSLEMKTGDSALLTATVIPANATNPRVTWKSSDTSVLTVTGGTVTALAGGTATVQAITNDGYYIAECQVKVSVPVTGVSLDKSSLAMTVGDSALLTATVQPANASNSGVVWKNSDASVLKVEDGKVTALAEGTATVQVVTNDGNYIAACLVKVSPQVDTSVPGIIGQPASLTRNYGESATFTLTASGSKLAYQWYKNNTALVGATQATYTVTAADMSSSSQGSYYCVVTNPYGTATSQTATLTVNSNLLSGTTIGSAPWDITTPYLVAQGTTATDMAITLQPVNANIAVYYGAQLLMDNTYHVDITKPLNKTYTFTLKAGNGYSVNYTVSVEKRFDFDAIVVTRWNNTLLVNANNTTNGGFGFTAYAWFKDGVQVGTEQYYSAGSHKSDVLSGSYYVVMTTSDGQTLRTWEKAVSVQSPASLKVSPNPVNAGAQLSVQLDLDPSLLDNAVIEVYNTYGTNLQKARATGSITQLSVPGQTGIYVVRVHAEGYTGEAKVVVK